MLQGNWKRQLKLYKDTYKFQGDGRILDIDICCFKINHGVQAFFSGDGLFSFFDVIG